MIGSFYISVAQAKPFNETEWGFLQLQIMGMRIEIVENDMRLCIDREDFRGDRKAASEDAVKQLKKLRIALKGLNLTPAAQFVKPVYENYIIELLNVYSDMPKKKDKEIQNGMKHFWEMVKKDNKVVEDAGQKFFETIPSAPKDFNPLDSELKLFKNEKDRSGFLKAD